MRRFILIFLSILVFHSLEGQDPSIRVMTFNIRLPHQGDGPNYWDLRRPHVASIIQFHEVDLLGVQEAHRRQLDEMVTDMPEYEWFGVCRMDGSTHPDPDGEFSAILYRKDRFQRLDGNTFWLSETSGTPGSKSWDAALPRIVTWAKFKDKQTGKIFFHFNTHFDHKGEQARLESAKMILAYMKTIAGDMPVVLTGDFNSYETDAPYLAMIDKAIPYHVTDAITLSKLPHHGPMSTFAGNFEISGMIDHRIDYIFVRKKIEVLRHGILSDNWHGKLASDHLPVFVEIRMK